MITELAVVVSIDRDLREASILKSSLSDYGVFIGFGGWGRHYYPSLPFPLEEQLSQ